MADTYDTLADLLILNDKNANDLGCSDLFNDAPFIRSLAAITASNGTLHKYVKETAAPTVGFRSENAGVFNSTGTEVTITSTLKIIDASFAVDKALADAYSKGGTDAYLARKAKAHLR